MARNTTISICKAFAIILMVMGHAECPALISHFLYEFHMPLFFITAGYFFSTKYLKDEKTFIVKRFKGLYIPFVKWSIFFLLIHNILFYLNIINDKFGNGTPGGVAHLYSFHELQQNIWLCVTEMGGYDVFITGAFWFFRALLVASILYLVLFKLFSKIKYLQAKDEYTTNMRIGITICLVMLLLAAWKTGCNLKIYALPQGGYRDIMGTFFFGIGFIISQNKKWLDLNWWTCLICFLVVAFFSVYGLSSMIWNPGMDKFLLLPVPAICGFFMTYYVSTKVDHHDNLFRRFMVYCGDNTLPIFIFHIISFKLVSLVKIWCYGLEFKQIGCHMVIHHVGNSVDSFWIPYTIVGVGLPLYVNYLYKRLKQRRIELKTKK
jgi:fucose 4-O-acetylase-like acetyltransferase